MFVNNLELRLPPLSLPIVQDNLSLAIFHDAGNIFVSGHDMTHNLLRWSQKDPQLCEQDSTARQCDYSYISHAIGIGIRYKTPIGPVRFDVGYQLNPIPGLIVNGEPQSRRWRIHFSIGQAF